jgi:MFS family permease
MGHRVHYAWVIAGVTFLALLASAGFRSTIGVFVIPLQEEFTWTRDQISLAVSINLVFYGLAAPFSAAFVERLGARAVMLASIGAVGAGAALTTLMTALWQLNIIWGFVIGSATGAISIPLSAVVATRWFAKRRGLVTGALAASFATGNLIFLPLLAWITREFGWRWAAGIIALTAAAILPIIAILMREFPADKNLTPYGSDEQYVPPPPTAHPFRKPFTVLRAVSGRRDFWLLAGTFFICGWTTNGAVQTHFIPASHDHGIPEVTAAGLLAMIGVFDIVGSTGSGWLTDRMDPRKLLLAYYVLRGLSLAALPFLFADAHHGFLIAFAVVYGLDWVATVPPTVALTNEAFEREQAPVVFGWVFASHMLGGALAAWLAGAFREQFGDYLVAFVGAGALGIVAGVAALGIGRGTRPVGPLIPQHQLD